MVLLRDSENDEGLLRVQSQAIAVRSNRVARSLAVAEGRAANLSIVPVVFVIRLIGFVGIYPLPTRVQKDSRTSS